MAVIPPIALQVKDSGGAPQTIGTTPVGQQSGANSVSSVPASDLANVEPSGSPITGASMPSGGVGLTGWLSAIWSKLSGTLSVSAASLPLPTGAAQESGGNLAAILTALQTNAPVSAFGTQITQSDSVPFTPGTKGTAFIVSVAGNAKVNLGSVTFLLPLQLGYTQVPLLLTQIWVTGSSATFTAYPV